MEHVAIMKKSWGLVGKIISGRKKIESRWYLARRAPWDKIRPGETVYFKDSGSPVTAAAKVSRVMQFSDLTPVKIKDILSEYGGVLGVDNIREFFKIVKDKKYCLLIFLKSPRKVTPFEIDKSGFGAMAAWISSDNINRIKIKS